MKQAKILALGLVALLVAACGKDPQPKPTPQPTNGYIELTPSRFGLASGQSQRITATVYVDGEALANPKIEWESSDPGLATVDQTGLVTATSNQDKEGVAEITATYGDLTATCNVRVSAPVLVEKLWFDADTIDMPCLSTLQLHPKYLPEDANMFNYKWETLNYATVNVDQTGLVTASYVSTYCTIIVTAEGGAKAQVDIHTINPYSMKQVNSLTATSGSNVTKEFSVDAQAGEKTYYYRIYDSRTKAFITDNNRAHFDWSSSNPDVASGDIIALDNGGYAHALVCKKTGTADVVLSYYDDDYLTQTTYLTVNVKGPEYFAENYFIGMTVGNNSTNATVYKNPTEVTLLSSYITFRVYDKDNQRVSGDFTWTLESDDADLIDSYIVNTKAYSGKPQGNHTGYQFGLVTGTSSDDYGKTSNLVVKVTDRQGSSQTLNLKVHKAAYKLTIGGVNLNTRQYYTGSEMEDFTYRMGSMSQKKYTNHLARFGMSCTEVTQGLWKAVMGSNPSSTSLNIGDNYPVNSISYDMALQFIARLNQKAAADYPGYTFRLPTESEWEYVASYAVHAKGHSTYQYPGSEDIDKVAWYSGNSGNNIHEVGLKTSNLDSGYDMAGNVSEWCSDWYADYPTTEQTHYAGPSTGTTRVVRGGAYNSIVQTCLWYYRSYMNPTSTSNTLGLRLAISYPDVVCEGKF